MKFIKQSENELSSNKSKFVLNVQVTNKLSADERGGIYVTVDDTDVSKTLFHTTFPANKTVTKAFEFNSKDVPVGKAYSAEVVYGDDFNEYS